MHNHYWNLFLSAEVICSYICSRMFFIIKYIYFSIIKDETIVRAKNKQNQKPEEYWIKHSYKHCKSNVMKVYYTLQSLSENSFYIVEKSGET